MTELASASLREFMEGYYMNDIDFVPQMANPNTIICRDCIYRDHTTVSINGKDIPVGTTKANCGKYTDYYGKSDDILSNNAVCKWYKKEES